MSLTRPVDRPVYAYSFRPLGIHTCWIAQIPFRAPVGALVFTFGAP